MVDIRLRERALTKAGYEVVYNEAMKGYHLRLPDGAYLSEHWTGLPDWFKTEDLAWRAAPAVETSVNDALLLAFEVGLVIRPNVMRKKWVIAKVHRVHHPHQIECGFSAKHGGDGLYWEVDYDALATAICQAYIECWHALEATA